MNESTVRSILRAHKVEVQLKQREEDDIEVRELPIEKRGRSLLLGDVLDLKKIRENDQPG